MPKWGENTNNRCSSLIPTPPPNLPFCSDIWNSWVHKPISATLMRRQMTYLLLITFSQLAAAPRRSTDSQRKSARIPIRQEIGSNTPSKLVLHTLLLNCSESVYSSFSSCKWQTAKGGKRTHKYFSTWEARWEEMRWEPVAKDYFWQIKLVWFTCSGVCKQQSWTWLTQTYQAPFSPRRNAQSLTTQGTFTQLHTGVRINAGFRWENLSAAPGLSCDHWG